MLSDPLPIISKNLLAVLDSGIDSNLRLFLTTNDSKCRVKQSDLVSQKGSERKLGSGSNRWTVYLSSANS